MICQLKALCKVQFSMCLNMRVYMNQLSNIILWSCLISSEKMPWMPCRWKKVRVSTAGKRSEKLPQNEKKVHHHLNQSLLNFPCYLNHSPAHHRLVNITLHWIPFQLNHSPAHHILVRKALGNLNQKKRMWNVPFVTRIPRSRNAFSVTYVFHGCTDDVLDSNTT